MKNTQQATKKRRNIILAIIAVVLAAVFAFGIYWGTKAFSRYPGPKQRIFIQVGADNDGIRDALVSQLGDYGADVAALLKLRDAAPQKAAGSYVIMPGDRAWSVMNRLRVGVQTPVRLTINQIRTMQQLAQKISETMMFSDKDFIAACDSVLPVLGYKKEQFPASFIPDTYEFFYTTPATDVVRSLTRYHEKFWDRDRTAKAQALGLTAAEIATIASIVEEESSKQDEWPKIARLYLNRLDRGMKLQADPTVKYALGDFAIRRVTHAMLDTDSPYNTYRHEGLPPGPIRIPEKAAIDAVLNAPLHDYIYMCAREDFSGYHNFACDLATHNANARRYQATLDARGIK